jgi:uncharacterized membrane protein YhaH (DUF805 family)
LYNPARPAGRGEFAWGGVIYPLGVNLLIALAGSIADAALFNVEAPVILDFAILLKNSFQALLWILLTVAGILIGIRRLKDLDRSGWYVLLALVPCVGAILVLYLLFAPGVAPSARRRRPGEAGATLPEEQLLSEATVSPDRTNRYLLWGGLAVIILACLGSLAFFTWIHSLAQVRAMGPWPGADVSPEEALAVDLSHLGLAAGQILDARDQEEWAEGGYQDGATIIYQLGGQDVVEVWALRYADQRAAADDFSEIEAWAADPGNCGLYTSAYSDNSGVIHCRFSNFYDKIFRNDTWIIDIVALEGTAYTPHVLVDAVRDALAEHWKTLSGPSA